MTAVYDKQYYNMKYAQKSNQFRRTMWVSEREFNKEEIQSQKVFAEGFYIFGGIDQNGAV